jgi:hypothetical protein
MTNIGKKLKVPHFHMIKACLKVGLRPHYDTSVLDIVFYMHIYRCIRINQIYIIMNTVQYNHVRNEHYNRLSQNFSKFGKK